MPFVSELMKSTFFHRQVGDVADEDEVVQTPGRGQGRPREGSESDSSADSQNTIILSSSASLASQPGQPGLQAQPQRPPTERLVQVKVVDADKSKHRQLKNGGEQCPTDD